MFFELFQYFLMLIIPGLLGALFFSLAANLTTEISWRVALILDLLTFTTMLIGLYFLHDVQTVEELLVEFNCLSFARNYILLSTAINIVFGIIGGLLSRLIPTTTSSATPSSTTPTGSTPAGTTPTGTTPTGTAL